MFRQSIISEVAVDGRFLRAEIIFADFENLWVLNEQTVVGLVRGILGVKFQSALYSFECGAVDRITILVRPVTENDLVVNDGVLNRFKLQTVPHKGSRFLQISHFCLNRLAV